MDTFSIPVLIKAVDFLFEEAKKILEERRERRKTQQKATKPKPVHDAPQITIENKSSDIIQSKEAALKTPVIEAVWLDTEEEIKHLVTLFEIHIRNYYLAKEQYAKWGSALVPLIILNTLVDEENAIAEITHKLQDTLSRVYAKKVIVPRDENWNE